MAAIGRHDTVARLLTTYNVSRLGHVAEVCLAVDWCLQRPAPRRVELKPCSHAEVMGLLRIEQELSDEAVHHVVLADDRM